MINEKTIQINGLNIYYRESGSGFPLILVHGMGGPLVWDEVIQPLSEFSKVIAIDLPGFGSSDKPSQNYTIDYYTDFLDSFIERLNLDKFNLAGLSLGGWIASKYVLKHPERIEKLVLLSSAGLKPITPFLKFPIIYGIVKIIMSNFIFKKERSLKKFQESAFFDKKKVTQENFEKFYSYINSPGAKGAYFSALKNVFKIDKNFRKDLGELNFPTLLIWGENDPTFPMKYALEFNKLIKNSDLKIIPQCGHTVTIEQPGLVCKIIEDFLKN